MQISALAKRTGVSAHALRHCEKLGLIQPARSNNGYRNYTVALRREVIFIAMSRQIGFSLKAIGAQLPAYRNGRLTVEQMVGAMRTRVADIDAQITSLRTQRSTVVSHIAWMKKQPVRAARPTPATENKPRPPWPSVKPVRPATDIPFQPTHEKSKT